jgi:uncharacterized membrane protein (UPF0127 family)
MKILNTTKASVLADKCACANNFFTRFKGLMGINSLPKGGGLLITPCNSIHMFFMKFPLDVVFIDKEGLVVHLIHGIRPWRLSPIVWKAHSVIELPTGIIRASNTALGDRIVTPLQTGQQSVQTS